MTYFTSTPQAVIRCSNCRDRGFLFDRVNRSAVACPECRVQEKPPPFHNPIYHKVDPDTSREAAEAITKSGRRKTDLILVLDAVRGLPGSTGTELYNAIPELNLYAVRRRLTDLHHKAWVRQGEKRDKQVTWWPEV